MSRDEDRSHALEKMDYKHPNVDFLKQKSSK